MKKLKRPTSLFHIPKYHKEIFGDNKPRSSVLVYIAVFGVSTPNILTASWSSNYKKLKRYVQNISTDSLYNYPIGEKWEKEHWCIWKNKNYNGLIKSIKADSIKIPLLVFAMPNKKCLVVEGRHRAGVAVLLGLKTVPAIVFEFIERKIV